MPEENQRITREHLPGLLLARAIWERGPSLYFPPALKTATDQARACSLEMKTHCVELYRDAPELHEVVLASEALAACAARDARIVELESGQSADMFLTLTGEITQLRAELAAIKAQEPVAVIHQQHGFCWYEGKKPQTGTKLYAAPVSEAKAQGGVMPELSAAEREGLLEFHQSVCCDAGHRVDKPGMNRLSEIGAVQSCGFGKHRLTEFGVYLLGLNAAPVQQVSVPDGWRLVKVGIEGVQFGNAWFSHEGITGYTADQLNSGNCRITGRAYMDWLAAAPAAPASGAGLVEALRELADQFREAWPEHTGKYHFLIGAGLSIVAHRSKGVV